MLIPVYGGWAHFGRIERKDGSAVATRCAHLYYLPLFPSGSVVIAADGRQSSAPLHLGSFLLALLRGWGLPLTVGLFFAGMGTAYSAMDPAVAAGVPALAVLIAAGWFASVL